MAEPQIVEQRNEAIKRLRSLFDMHSIPFGAPENLGALLLSLHESRHFTMDFWSLINALSDSGSGALNEEQTLEAVVESVAGVGINALPAHERPGADELRQLLAGVDVSRPAELPQPIAQPVDALLPRTPEEGKFTHALHTLSGDEALTKRRAIGDALAKLEQSTRELRAQLAEIDAQMSGSSTAPESTRQDEVAEPALNVIKVTEEQRSQTLSRWDRMSPFSEGRANEIAPDAEKSISGLQEQARLFEETPSQVASPLAEAAPPRPVAVPERPLEPPPAPAPSAPVVSQPVVSPQAQQAPVRPEPVVVSTKLPEPPAVFDPRPAATLGHRGLAIPDPDDDPSIKAPFSEYATEREASSLAKLFGAAVIVALLAAGAYAGATHTEIGRAWWQNAVQFVHEKISSSTNQQSSATVTPAPVNPQPATPAATEEPAASAPAAAPQDSNNAAPAAPMPVPQQTPAPAAPQAAPHETKRPADSEENAPRQRASQTVVDESVLRVPASTMAANLVTSRVPAYPEAARAQGIEGSVVMEVIVSQTGMVKYARVIDGDRHLRAAAEDAVLRWHYKPYVLNGEPVEVSTTVKVDFRLPR